jgi:ribosomal protein S18 acetylase RimI-like enzyme
MTSELTVVTAGPADRNRLTALVGAFHAEEGTSARDRSLTAGIAGLLADPTLGRIWLLVKGGTDVGYAVLAFGYSLEFGGRDGFVDELYVVPGQRGAGVGREALARIELEARRLELVALHLEVKRTNDRAIRIYEAHGFENRASHHLMSKRLDRRPDADAGAR